MFIYCAAFCLSPDSFVALCKTIKLNLPAVDTQIWHSSSNLAVSLVCSGDFEEFQHKTL